MRLDEELVNRGLVDSRNKAKEIIKSSKVKVNSKIITKPSFKVTSDDLIEITDEKIYVSRAALKLKNYLDKYNIDFKNKSVLYEKIL